ncbi:MAG: glycoside hydrolase family 16 protein [Xanthomonadales bacterium]|nr:glycoside hydrolase family 16 protein [Xanthomonadales bacterium]
MRKPLFAAPLLVAPLLGIALAALPLRLAAEEILLFDDFDGPALNASLWGLADWTIGDRTQFGKQPEFATESPDPLNPTTFIRLLLDTYSPVQPGQRLYGTEIYSLRNFTNTGGVEYLARARLATDSPGLVAAFFTYNQRRQKGRWLSDEIDFEVLSKQATDKVLVTSWDDWGAAGSDYEDGVHHLGALLTVPGFDWRQWNTYAMRWYPDHIEWYVNEELVRTHTAPVPDQEQPARASLWAAGTTWPDAYDASLAPVGSAAENVSFAWDIDFIMVTRLTGDGGGGGTEVPAAPSGLGPTTPTTRPASPSTGPGNRRARRRPISTPSRRPARTPRPGPTPRPMANTSTGSRPRTRPVNRRRATPWA